MAGRARGRARGVPAPAAAQPPAGAPAPAAPAPSSGPPPGWAGVAPSRGDHVSRPVPVAPVPQMQGLSISSGSNGRNGNGNGNGHDLGAEAPSIGRGSLRGGIRPSGFRVGDVEDMRPQGHTGKQGVKGQAVTLNANYIRVITKSKEPFVIHHHHVAFEPAQDVEIDKKRLVASQKEVIGSWYLFDGASLFSFKPVTQPTTPFTFIAKNSKDENVTVTITHVGEIKSTDYIVLQVLSILMRRAMDHLQFKMVGIRREYFDMAEGAKIAISRFNLDLAPGYVATIRQQEHELMLCVGVKHKVIRRDTVMDHMIKLRKDVGDANLRQACQDLINCTVLTKYNNESYKIDDFDWDSNPNSTFDWKGKGQTSYVEYYKQRYNISIRIMSQPMLISRPTKKDRRGGEQKPAYLVPELCFMTGISEAMRNDFNLKREMLTITSLEPMRLKERYMALLAKMQSSKSVCDDLEAWGLSLDRQLIEFAGRNLGQQDLSMKATKFQTGDKADWGHQMKSNAVEVAGKLRRWVVISTNQDRNVAQDFISGMNRVFQPMRLDGYTPPTWHGVENDRTGTFQAKIQELQQGQDMICMIFPNNKADRYHGVKKLLCCDYPVPSQVVLVKTLQKGKSNLAVCTKVAGQINCKLGGALWRVTIPVKNLMVCGYDAYHDSKLKGKSVGSLIASLDQGCTTYFSTSSYHATREEMGPNIAIGLDKCLRAFHSYNGAYPEKVLFYRDGVGEGQLQQVKNVEVALLKSKIQEVTGLPPKLAFIVVSKRINTKLFELDMRKNPMNPRPGTVVDNHITCPEFQDFFLVAQSVRQGTVCPVSFNIIEDTGLGLSADHYQLLTYRLCHMYFNWPGTVRVPAHCQMAHKLAFLTGQSLHKEADVSLANKQFFL